MRGRVSASHLAEEVQGCRREREAGGGVHFSSSRKDLHCLPDLRRGGAGGLSSGRPLATLPLCMESVRGKPALLFPAWFKRSLVLR